MGGFTIYILENAGPLNPNRHGAGGGPGPQLSEQMRMVRLGSARRGVPEVQESDHVPGAQRKFLPATVIGLLSQWLTAHFINRKIVTSAASPAPTPTKFNTHHIILWFVERR